MSLAKTVACIKKSKSFLITSHTNPEGDSLGSELAFFALAQALGKKAIIINEDSLPYGFEFLPYTNSIKKFSPKLKNISFDCFVILDCSNLKRSGEVYKLNKANLPILNIDHHISNRKFGTINWVDATTSSCCQMVYRLFKKLHVPFEQKTATLLYVGMLTDTGSFHYANTSPATHRAVAELLRYNISPTEVYKNLYERIPFQDIKFLSKLLTRIRLFASGRVAWIELSRDIVRKRTFSFDLTERVLSFTRAIKGVEVAVVFKENQGIDSGVRVNLRSQGNIDVNRIAHFFGGGGHRLASSCIVRESIINARNRVLEKIKESLDEDNTRPK